MFSFFKRFSSNETLVADNEKLANKIKELKVQLAESKKTIEDKEVIIYTVSHQRDKANNAYESLKDDYDKALSQIEMAKGQEIAESLGFPFDEFPKDLSKLSADREAIEKDISYYHANKIATFVKTPYLVNGSRSKGEQFQKTYADNMVTGLNAYFTKKMKAVTEANYAKTKDLIIANYERANKKGDIVGVNIADNYFNLYLKLLDNTLAYKKAKIEEKERIKEERRRMKEEEQLLADAEKERQKLKKERRMYEQNLEKALSEEEKAKFEAKLKEIDKREKDIDYRVNNKNAGYIYIASTPSMPGIIKVGSTKRLNPLIRIQEISSASVPFPFICHGLIFSDNVFELEANIHNCFDNSRTNKENKHKEFFNLTPKSAIRVIEDRFGVKVHFISKEENEEENA